MNTENVEQPINQEQQEINEQAVEQEKVSLDVMIAEYSQKTREELLQEIKNLLDKGDFEQMKSRIPLINNAFNNLPKPKVEKVENNEDDTQQTKQEEVNQEDEIETSFRQLYNIYKEKRQEYQQKEEEQKENNFKKKQSLLEDLKKLLDSEQTLKEIYDEFNAIQEKWKEIGNVPHNEVNNLWENYHFLMDKFYEKVKINKELRDLDMKKNLESKIELCEKVEQLLLVEDINESFSLLQEYHKQWKEIGPVPSDKNDEIWERFKRASDAINTRRREFYEQKKGEIEENIKQKNDLIEKVSKVIANEFKTMGDWNKATEEIKQLFDSWKTIGIVPRKDNEVLWAKFKTMIDGFYSSRKEAMSSLRQEEDENLNKKIALCVKAEEIAKRTDFDQATKDIKQLQEDWKTTGFVKRAVGEKVWTRFRAACDEFFKQKSESYLKTHQEVVDNIKKKEDLLEELKNHTFTEDKQENVNTLKDFQKRWFEIGFTPRIERKKLQEEWDNVINANRDKLQITAEEIASRNSNNNKRNINTVVESASKNIQRRIKEIDNEIIQLENNLGFFANSKNADILKKEFEAKIDKLRKEKNDFINKMKAEDTNNEQQESSDNLEKTTENTENN
ncbi:MAG: DUF349 domain-containing protein [Bacteroidales bacterium]|jgi:hypothetical protein|nr:DUF349 domain-containing protein [Bacteroidales bacterium]